MLFGFIYLFIHLFIYLFILFVPLCFLFLYPFITSSYFCPPLPPLPPAFFVWGLPPPARRRHQIDVAVDGDPADTGAGQQLGDCLADPAETRDDDVVAGSVGNDVDDVDALRDRGELNAVTLAAGAPRISMAGWRC